MFGVTRRELLTTVSSATGGTIPRTESKAPTKTDTELIDTPTFQYDNANTGSIETQGPSGQLRSEWSYQVPGPVVAPPTVVGDTVFIPSKGSRRESPFVDKSAFGSVHAVDRATGDRRWVFETNSDVLFTPTIADGIVYIPAEESLIGVDAATGTRQFSFDADSTGPPIVADKLYAVGWDTAAFDIDTLQLSWSVKTGDPVSYGIGYGSDKVFVSSHKLFAINSATGDIDWEWPSDIEWIDTEPTIIDDSVYVATAGGTVASLRTQDGHQEWKYETEGQFFVSPAVKDGLVIVSGGKSRVYALDADNGDLVWEYETPTLHSGSPCIAGKTVYITNGDRLYLLRLADGSVRSVYKIPRLKSPPVATSDAVYIGTESELVSITDQRDSSSIPHLPPRETFLSSRSMFQIGGALTVGVGAATLVAWWRSQYSEKSNAVDDVSIEEARKAIEEARFEAAAKQLRLALDECETKQSEVKNLLDQTLEWKAEQDSIKRQLSKAEENYLEAVTIHIDADSTNALTSYQTALDAYDSVLSQLDSATFDQLFPDGCTIDLDESIEVDDLLTIEGIEENQLKALAALGIESHDDLFSNQHDISIAAPLETIDEQTILRLQALSWLSPNGCVELEDFSEIERRHNRIESILDGITDPN
jgi:outer membrane protein assembly factor BamB